MAFTRVQGANNSQFGGTTLTATFGAALTVGNIVVVGISLTAGAQGPGQPSLTDDKGNVYRLARFQSNNYWNSQYYSIITVSGATILTLVAASGGSSLVCDEYAGNPASDIVGAGSDGNGTTTSTSVTAFAPTPGNLVVATIIALNDTVAAGAGYTLGSNRNSIANIYNLSCGASETAPATLTRFQGSNDNWSEVAVEYSLTALSRQAAFREKYSQLIAQG